MTTFRSWALGVAVLYASWALARVRWIPGLEWDEAEQVLHAQHLQWGYGPQPPLMEWLVWALRQIVPISPLTALLAIKASLLWGLAVVAAWTVARAVRDVRWGVASGSWLLTLTPLLWDGPRSLTHSLLAATAIGAVLAAGMPLLTHPLQPMSARRWWALGLACSAALLAKYNTVLVLAALFVTWMVVLWRACESKGGWRYGMRQHLPGMGWMALGLLPLLSHMWWLWQYRLGVSTAIYASIHSGAGAHIPLLGEALVAWISTCGVSLAVWGFALAATPQRGLARAVVYMLGDESGAVKGHDRWRWTAMTYMLSVAALLFMLVVSGVFGDVEQNWILPMAVPVLVLFAVDRGPQDRAMARAMTIGSVALVVLGLALLLVRPVVLERLGRSSWSQLPARDVAQWIDSLAGPQTVVIAQPIHLAGAIALHTSAVRWVAYSGASPLAIPADVSACDIVWVSPRVPESGSTAPAALGYRTEGPMQTRPWHTWPSATVGGTIHAQRWVTDARPCPALRSVYDRLP